MTSEFKKQLPMWLTWSRIVVCPIFVALLTWPNEWTGWIAGILFIFASLTDWWDGALARKYNVESNLGKLMDPIADKILVLTVLVMLIPSQRIEPVLVLLLVARDILIGGIRSAAAADKLIISAAPAGKWKTGFQMVGIPAILIGDIWLIPVQRIGWGLLWLSLILSAFSGAQYMIMYFQNRKKTNS